MPCLAAPHSIQGGYRCSPCHCIFNEHSYISGITNIGWYYKSMKSWLLLMVLLSGYALAGKAMAFVLSKPNLIRAELEISKFSPATTVTKIVGSKPLLFLTADLAGQGKTEIATKLAPAVNDATTLIEARREGYNTLIAKFDSLPLLNRAIILSRMGLDVHHLDSGMAQELVAIKAQAPIDSRDIASIERLADDIYITSIDFENYLPSLSSLTIADMQQAYGELTTDSKATVGKVHMQDKKTDKQKTIPAIIDKGDSPLLAVDVLKKLAQLFVQTDRHDLIERLNQLDWDETRELVRKIKQKSYLSLFDEGNPKAIKRLDGEVAQSSLDIIYNNYLRFDVLRLGTIAAPKHHGFDSKEVARANRLRESVEEMNAIEKMPYSQERGEMMAAKLATVSTSEYWSYPPLQKISDLESSELGKTLLQDLTPSTIYALFAISGHPMASVYDQAPLTKRLARLDMLAEELQALPTRKPKNN